MKEMSTNMKDGGSTTVCGTWCLEQDLRIAELNKKDLYTFLYDSLQKISLFN